MYGTKLMFYELYVRVGVAVRLKAINWSKSLIVTI